MTNIHQYLELVLATFFKMSPSQHKILNNKSSFCDVTKGNNHPCPFDTFQKVAGPTTLQFSQKVQTLL